MNAQERLFAIELEEEALILTPIANLNQLELSSLDDAINTLLQQLASLQRPNILLDCAGTDYFGSTPLGFFIKLWKRVSSVGGTIVFCNVSPHEREVLKLTHLDTLWSICGTRDEARQLLRSKDA